MQLHRPPFAAAGTPRLNDDLFDQGADHLPRCAAFRARQVRIEFGHGLLVHRLIVRRQLDLDLLGDSGDLLHETGFGDLEILEAPDDGLGQVVIFFQPLHELGDAVARVYQLHFDALPLQTRAAVGSVKLVLQFGGEALDEARRQKALANTCQDTLLQLSRGDGAVGTAASPVPATAPASRTGGDELLAAHAAGDEVRQQVLRPLRAREWVGGQLELLVAGSTRLLLARLHTVPQVLVDDALLGVLSDDPLRRVVEPGLAREAALVVRHLNPPPPVEDTLSDISPIVEDALAALDVAGQRGRIPVPGLVAAAPVRARRRDTLAIEGRADRLQAETFIIQREDAPDESRLGLDDGIAVDLATLAVLTDDDPLIAERLAAGGACAVRLPLQSSTGLVRSTSTLFLGDEALERQHQVIDGSDRDGVKDDLVRPQQLRHVLEVLLVAAEPVDILDDEDADFPRLDDGQHRMETRPFHGGTGDAIIAVKRDQIEAVLLGIAAGSRLLIFDRRCLAVRIVEAQPAVSDCDHVPVRQGAHSDTHSSRRWTRTSPGRRAKIAASRSKSRASRSNPRMTMRFWPASFISSMIASTSRSLSEPTDVE